MEKVFNLQELDRNKIPEGYKQKLKNINFTVFDSDKVPVEIKNPKLEYKYGLLFLDGDKKPISLVYFENNADTFSHVRNPYDNVTFKLTPLDGGGGKRKRKSRRVKKSKRRNGRKSRKH